MGYGGLAKPFARHGFLVTRLNRYLLEEKRNGVGELDMQRLTTITQLRSHRSQLVYAGRLRGDQNRPPLDSLIMNLRVGLECKWKRVLFEEALDSGVEGRGLVIHDEVAGGIDAVHLEVGHGGEGGFVNGVDCGRVGDDGGVVGI
jgi:hypothetical protein